MPGLLDYGRESMPGMDQRSILDQLLGMLGVGKPYAEKVGGLLGYTPGMGQALTAENQGMQQRMQSNPGQPLASLFPPTERRPANEAFGSGLLGAFMAPTRAVYDIPTPSWYRGDATMEAIRNPTQRDVGKLIKQHGPLRAVKDQYGDIYVWPGETALHEEVIRALSLGDRTENMGVISSPTQYGSMRQ